MIIFYGFGGDLGYGEGNLYELISQKARACGVTAVRFDFSGCGKSQGHSQGGVVAGMLAGLYPDIVKKLILLAPAATLKTDAQKGVCMGTFYDTEQVPEIVLVDGQHPVGGHYFRIAKNLPIYEITSKYTGRTLLIHGISDAIVDYHASLEYHHCMPGSRLNLYEELDHGIDGKDRDEVLEEIEEFLRE